ncbi:MAG: efflux RND transporter permease subunit [Pseudomonadota bacterium]
MSSEAKKSDISTVFFRNRHLLVLTICILLIGGLGAIKNLPRLEDPRITTRVASILTFLPGASASRVEALINKKIEDTLEEIDDIKNIESTARPGISNITIELNDNVTPDTNEEIFSKIRSRLQNVSNELPPDATLPFLDDNRAVAAYTLIFGISWDQAGEPPLNLLQRVALDLKDSILNTSNTELVRIFGGIEEEITVTPDKAELMALGVTADRLAEIIANADSKVSAGIIHTDSQDFQIEIDGALTSVDRIARIPILSKDNGSTVKVGDIAHIEKSYAKPPKQVGLKDGKRIIYVAVRSDAFVRSDIWTKNILETFDVVRAKYSSPIDMDIIFEQNKYTQARLNDLVTNLFLGALVVIAIVLLTMGWVSALIVGSVLPLACAGSIFAFNFFGQSIHQMSIFGMIIAIGILIDSAIVMTDEVRKSILDKGMSKIAAMRHSIHHLFVPLLASTLTTILGFMPIFLLPGSAGDFVGPIALSVVLSLIFSFMLAMTVIPALAAIYGIEGKRTGDNPLQWWQIGLKKPAIFEDFKSFSLTAIQNPKRYIWLSIIPCILGFILTSTLKVEFFPPADRNMFEIQVFLPGGSASAYARNQVKIADEIVKSSDKVTDIYWVVGTSTPQVYYNQFSKQDDNNSYAQAVVTLQDNSGANSIMADLQNKLNLALPDARPVVKKFAQGPPADAPVALRILGPDITILQDLGEQVRAIMHQNPEIIHTRASIEGGQPKLWLRADEAKADVIGLDLTDIARQFQGSLEGYKGGSILEDVEELPVRVRLEDKERNNITDAANMQLLADGRARWIPAEAIGKIELSPEISEISRYNGQRVNNIFAFIKNDAKPVSVSSAIEEKIAEQMTIPSGYEIDVAGESEEQAEAVGGLATFAPVLLTMMVATIILAFRSVALAVIVFTVAFLSIGLGMLSLKIAGYPLGFNPLIGSIGLSGVVINDTIVILAAILGNERAKYGDGEQIIKETYGCGRHVLSTTFTTIGGFIPLLLFSGGSFWPPLTVVIAGGIGFSLILAMFFTPLAYKIYADFYYRRARELDL